MTDKNDYEVGYGRPPREHQFPKGKSGNPNGRPKKERPIDQDFKHIQFEYAFLDDAERKINTKMNGQEVELRKIEAIVAQLGNKALQGHIPAARLYLQHHGVIAKRHDDEVNELRDILRDIDEKRWREVEEMTTMERTESLMRRWKNRKWMRDRGEDIPYECEEPVNEQDWSEWYKYAGKIISEDPDPGQWPPAYWDDPVDE